MIIFFSLVFVSFIVALIVGAFKIMLWLLFGALLVLLLLYAL